MNAIGSILVVRLSALGDVVLALPTVDALRARFPDAHLAFLSRREFGAVLAGAATIDRVLLWDGPGEPLPEEAAARRWDLIVDLSGTGRSRRLLAGLHGARRLRAQKQTLRRFAFVHWRGFGAGRVEIASAMDRMASALAPLGIGRDGRTPSLLAGVSREFREHRSTVLLAPGGGRGAKLWPVERFAAIARDLTARGVRILAIGSLEEEELLHEAVRGAAADRVRVIAGADPAALPGFVAACDVALTNDSGLLHVAEACGVPVVALFGPTHPRLGFAPWRADSIALHTGIGCSPCDLHGPERCPRGHHRCLRDLEITTVARALDDRLARPRGR